MGKWLKWLGLQIAGKALGLALGLPAVTGAVMATLAYMDRLPLATSLLFVLLAMAAVATLLNQIRPFLVAQSLIDKVRLNALLVEHAYIVGSNPPIEGYSVGVSLENISDMSLEYLFEDAMGSVDNLVLLQAPGAPHGDTIEPRSARSHGFGIAKMPRRPSERFVGDLSFTFRYGRPGKLSHSKKLKYMISFVTDENGNAHSARFGIKPRA